MSTLQDVQTSVHFQVQRDLGEKPVDVLKDICLLGLAEEAGEVVGLRKRELRQFGPKDVERSKREYFVEELGDVLWYLAAVCDVYGITLDELWDYNVEKLVKRYGK